MIPVYAAASEEHYNDIAHVIPLVTRAMFKEFTPRVALIGWTEAQVDELRNMVQLYTGRSIEPRQSSPLSARALYNGYPPRKPWGFLNKSGSHGWGRMSIFSDRMVGSQSIGHDFTDGHRGMARAVRGAKKFVRSRIRASEKMTLIEMMQDPSLLTGDTDQVV
jgi:hypothetical protein